MSIGLFYDRWKERKARAEREETRRRQHREQEATQLRIIEWLVNENVDLCKQVLAAVRADQPFYFRMNTHLLDASLVTLSTLTTDSVTTMREVWTVGIDGTAPIQLTTGYFDQCPVWTADGHYVAFSRYASPGGRPAAGGVYLVPALGGTATRLVGLDPGGGPIARSR